MSYKPDAFPSLSPYLIVDDATAALAFNERVFAWPPMRIHRRADGGIKHAEARVFDGVVMMGEMAGGPDAHLHFFLADVEAVFDRAVAAGGTVVQPLQRGDDDGDLRGGVRDPQGTTWWLARQEAAAASAGSDTL